MKLFSCWIIAAALAFGQQSPDVRLKAAMHKEEVEGDLKGAIEAYRKIVAGAGSNRALAATALYRLGECYRKQGDAEARKTYERLVKDYADQSVAADARARLASMDGGPTREVRARLLWDKAADTNGTTTADGRYLSYTDWDTGDLFVRDLVARQSRNVTNWGGYDKSKAEVENSAISPDGKRIAYTVYRWGKGLPDEYLYELHCIDADGARDRIILKGDDLSDLNVGSWSPEMKWIAAEVVYRAGGKKILLISPDNEPAKTAFNPGGLVSNMMRFSPDGKWLAVETRRSSGSLSADPTVRSVTVVPVNGPAGSPTEVAQDARLMGWVPAGDALLFAREFNGVGTLYRLPMAAGKAAGDPQAVRSAPETGSFLGLTANGTLIQGRAKGSIDAVTLPLNRNGAAAPTPKLTRPIFQYGFGGMSGGIRYSPDGKRVLYTTAPKTILIRSLTDGSEHTIMVQMVRMGRIEWTGDSKALLISGAVSGGTEGVYRVDPESGAATFLFAGESIWLMAPAPDGSTLYYRKNRAPVVARDLRTGEERTMAEAPTATFDLKISRDGKYLAVVGFRNLRIVNVVSGEIRTLFEPADYDSASNPAFQGGDWSADGSRFFVMASLDNHHRRELWAFPATGGEPTREKLDGQFRGVWITPDGTQFATVRQDQVVQVWAIENFLPK